MFRLLRCYVIPSHNLSVTTVQRNLQQNNHICSFCNFHHLKSITYFRNGSLHRRMASTNTATADKATPKNIKHKEKKYAELLEVSGRKTKNTKATVQKLNAVSVSKLANEPEISLDQIHEIDGSNTLPGDETWEAECEQDIALIESEDLVPQRNLESEDIEEDPMAYGALDQTTLIKNTLVYSNLKDYSEDVADESTFDSEIINETIPKKKKSKVTRSDIFANKGVKAVHVKSKELTERARRVSFVRNLEAYLNVSVNSGMSSEASRSLLWYRKRGMSHKTIYDAINIRHYNIILRAFASVGNLEMLKAFVSIITQDSLTPNIGTYVTIFECVGRITEHQSDKGYLKSVVSDMMAKQISFNDLLNQSDFVKDQREMVLRGIRLLNPNFEPIYTPPNTNYENHLLDEVSKVDSQGKSPAEGLFSASELCERAKRQIELESLDNITVKSIAINGEPSPTVLAYRKKLVEYEEMWRRAAVEAFRRDVHVLKSKFIMGGSLQRTINIYPYLKVLDEHHYVDIILNEIKRLGTGSEMYSPPLNVLARGAGRRVFQKYMIELHSRHGRSEKAFQIYVKYCDRYLNGYNGMNARSIWQNIIHEEKRHGPTPNIVIPEWPANVYGIIGRFMYDIILKDIRIDINCMDTESKSEKYLPGFYSVFRNNRLLVTQEVKPHPVLSQIYKEAHLDTIQFRTPHVPTLIPPVPWHNVNFGGYLVACEKIMRLRDNSLQQWRRLRSTPQNQMYPVLDSLNQLSSIPWRINKLILDIAVKLFQDGGSKKLDIPEHDAAFPPATPTVTPKKYASKEERMHAAKTRIKEKRTRLEVYSLWCDTLYKLSLANHFRDEVFWLPHNLDFRGRVYPIPPHLHHLGSDLARSLMVFALGKPLGPDGLDWLKIHVINITGLKKRESNDKRLEHANEILPKILDSAENPFTGEKWWQKSENPWQTLAACFEIANALKSPNPSEYVSHFAVHQDGSCNGLQHYAALARDEQGAETVNLIPGREPQDVYSSVVALVEKERQADAEKGQKVAQLLDGLVGRKVIKQTVMTTVYGVTRFGARLQIARQLKDIEFSEEYLWRASNYLVSKTFNSLREMFTGTKLIQDWLTECARYIAHDCTKNVEWVTPLGLPIVQPYSRPSPVVVGQTLNAVALMDMYNQPNVMKQKNAFPPNFIHSLDSSHMMLTSLYCEHAGITFVSVHDCYWTHASTIHVMNKICREQFVALHSEPILDNLSTFLVKKFGKRESELFDVEIETKPGRVNNHNILKQVPTTGTFDVKKVLDSEYFFS
ncbi:DNA-directed RNA polymerase, mitochondrial [Diprion similis]|uniref:DNA-directed RNA polymerase, mitochondrial n=1 Tax=Diprion similis TaxID=362088 RepID=UPI001EF836CD|nr:DNA-directed RNA polymerase, mitochondrial [Diprion similis]XP_046738304.1 DNA-directed RNA polymerase, mitochondrial [Diprion similis]